MRKISIPLIMCLCTVCAAMPHDSAYAGAAKVVANGAAATVGVLSEVVNTGEFVAKAAMHTQAYFEAKKKLESSNVPQEIRERYLESLLKYGSADDFAEDLARSGYNFGELNNESVDMKNKINKLKREQQRLQERYGVRDLGEVGYAQELDQRKRLAEIKKLEDKRKNVEDKIAQHQTLCKSYHNSLEKLKTEEGRMELKEDLATMRENLSENYAMRSDFLDQTGEAIKNDFVMYINGRVVGGITGDVLGSYFKSTGILAQMQQYVCPMNEELTKMFLTNMTGHVISFAADQGDISIGVPGLQELADWLMEDPAITAKRMEQKMSEEEMADWQENQLERMSPSGLGSELELMDGLDLRPDFFESINAEMIKNMQRKVRRSSPAKWLRYAQEDLMTEAELKQITSKPNLGAGYKIDACLKYQNQRIARSWASYYYPAGIQPPTDISNPWAFGARIPTGVEYQSMQLEQQRRQQANIQAMSAFAGAIAAAYRSAYDSREGYHAPGTCGRKRKK